MFDQTTSSPTPNAISSPASGCGPTLFAAQAGQMIDLFGPVPVLANLSPRQARELGLMMSATFGRTSIGSSASASLQSFLESRLQAKTQILGSTLYRLTWKPWRTPSGAIPFPAAGVGAPNIRDRLYWMAHAHSDGREPRRQGRQALGHRSPAESDRGAGRLGDASSSRLEKRFGNSRVAGGPTGTCQGEAAERAGIHIGTCDSGPVNGFWRDADWLGCRDGKFRPVEPGTFPLADGAPARVGRLRAYGNAINAEAAVAFIQSAMDSLP